MIEEHYLQAHLLLCSLVPNRPSQEPGEPCVRMSAIKKIRNNSVGEDMEKKEPSYTAINCYSYYGK